MNSDILSRVCRLLNDEKPVRVAIERDGIAHVLVSDRAVTPDDIDALIEVLLVQKRELLRQHGAQPSSEDE